MFLPHPTTLPDPIVFFRRGDPNDHRLGECVSTHANDYDDATIVLLGLPQDEGVQRNHGRTGASQAPTTIRRALYKLIAIPGLTYFDAGDTTIANTLEETHERHRAIAEKILKDNKTLITLGGGNDTSYPDGVALATVTGGDLLAFNIDAHFDVRIAPQANSGTPYRQLLEGQHFHPSRFHEFAYNPSANSPVYVEYLQKLGVQMHSIENVHKNSVEKALETIILATPSQAIFWGVDMDVVCSADAPGVSAPNALGISAHELITIAKIAGSNPRTRLFEVTEVNPLYDIDDRTSRLAAVAIWHFLREHTQIVR